MKKDLKTLFQQYGHFLMLLYAIPYAIWFWWLQAQTEVTHYVINCSWDQYIPFLDFFVVPYVFWYAYMVLGLLYFVFRSQKEFIPMGIMLIVGLTACLLTYTFWPNALELRQPFAEENIFTAIIGLIRSIDPPMNVCPSMHVYGTVVVHAAIVRSSCLKEERWYSAVKYGSWISTILICMSTVFIKQHSIVDVFASIALWLILHILVYKVKWPRKA